MSLQRTTLEKAIPYNMYVSRSERRIYMTLSLSLALTVIASQLIAQATCLALAHLLSLSWTNGEEDRRLRRRGRGELDVLANEVVACLRRPCGNW
jgi:hypothetical protein